MLHAAGLVVHREGKPPVSAHAPLPADFRALGFVDPKDAALAALEAAAAQEATAVDDLAGEPLASELGDERG